MTIPWTNLLNGWSKCIATGLKRYLWLDIRLSNIHCHTVLITPMSATITCYQCKGKGRIPLTQEMRRRLAVLKKIGPTTASKFAEKSGLESSNATHLLKRMAAWGLVKVEGEYPAKYSVMENDD